MPRCGSQVLLCDLPIRLDTYCFAQHKHELANIKKKEGPVGLRNFIEGRRCLECCWCDWDIPIHWGGTSDPFQPIEERAGASRACLEVFAETGYPFIFSTKATLPTRAPYRDLIAKSNAVAQVSMVCPEYDRFEKGAPTFRERLAALDTLAEISKRLIIRIAPYSAGLVEEVSEWFPAYARAGVHGVSIEGMKRRTKKRGWVRVGGDVVYPVEVLREDFGELKKRAHEAGLKFYCAENRLRAMGDSPVCCGTDGLKGFIGNTTNMNHMTKAGKIAYTPKMKETGTAQCFKTISQQAGRSRTIKELAFSTVMDMTARVRGYRIVMGMEPERK